jgi:hypothetical protein
MNAMGQRTEGNPIRAALLQERGSGRLDPEIRSLADELSRRGISVRFFLEKHLQRGRLELHRDVLVAGHIPVVVQALRRLDIEPPPPDDYPQALRPWLRRRVWESTVGDVVKRLQDGGDVPFFVKPTRTLKRFAGRVGRVVARPATARERLGRHGRHLRGGRALAQRASCLRHARADRRHTSLPRRSRNHH